MRWLLIPAEADGRRGVVPERLILDVSDKFCDDENQKMSLSSTEGGVG